MAEMELEQTAVPPPTQTPQPTPAPQPTNRNPLHREQLLYLLYLIPLILFFSCITSFLFSNTSDGIYTVTLVAPTIQNNKTLDPNSPILFSQPLSDKYNNSYVVYNPTRNLLVTESRRVFNIYDLNQLIENQAIRYTTLQLVQREDINAIRFSTLNPQYLLISHDSKDHTLLDIPTLDSIVQHIYVYPISEACDIIDPNTSEDCFVAPTSVPEPQEGCPIIWQGEGNFYLTQCAEIYWQPEDSSPILARTISLQSNIIQLEQTEDDRLVIIGENRLTILDSQTMQGDIYTIGDLETEAQYLFIDKTQEQFFIVHHPKSKNTSWITVGTLK